jgi:hypothetical protein
MGIGGPVPEGKARQGRDADHSNHLLPRSRMSGRYTASPSCRLHGGSRAPLLLKVNNTRVPLNG